MKRHTSAFRDDQLEAAESYARGVAEERARLTNPETLRRHLEELGVVGIEAVAEAVAVERERCARIAETFAAREGWQPLAIQLGIAHRIRESSATIRSGEAE